MKSLILIMKLLIPSLFFLSTSYAKVSVHTLVTCADQVTEVGIALDHSPNLKALIVSKTELGDKLIYNSLVYSFERSEETTYEDNRQTFKLAISRIMQLGKLKAILDNSQNLILNGLICYKNSSISYDE